MLGNNIHRPTIATAYRDHMIATLGYELPRVSSADELLALARRVGPPAFEAAQGLRTEPPFPGVHETPEETTAGWRMICACRLYSGEHEAGVIFMTFFGGRPIGLVVSPPGTEIPKEYSPLASR